MSHRVADASAPISYAREVASIRLARQHAGDLAGQLAGGSCVDAVRLLVTELVTNSVRYATGSQVRLRVAGDPQRVRVEVQDDGPGFTGPRTPDPVNGGGYGLVLVDELAADWGVNREADTTTVWFEVPCGEQSAGAALAAS